MTPRHRRTGWSLALAVGAHALLLVLGGLLLPREPAAPDARAPRVPAAEAASPAPPADTVEPVLALVPVLERAAAIPADEAATEDATASAAPLVAAPVVGAPSSPAPGGGPGAPVSAGPAVALLDVHDTAPDAADAADAIEGTTTPEPGPGAPGAKGKDAAGPSAGPGKGAGIDLFPEDVLRGVALAGIPKGEAEEIKFMLDRYVATTKAYARVKGGLAPPFAAKFGKEIPDLWEEEILPSDERTLGEGVKRWFRDLKDDPARILRDMAAALATTLTDCTIRPARCDGTKLTDGDVGDVADAWEWGRKRGLAMIGVRADGSLVGIRMLKSTGNVIFDDALRDAVVKTLDKVGPPSPDLVRLTGETWLLYEVTAAITVMPPGAYVAGRFMADFTKPELLYPFKVLVNAKAELRAVFDRGEDYDPSAPPVPSPTLPGAR